MQVGYMIVALMCSIEDPTICDKYGLGWTITPEACVAASKATKVRPPRGYTIKAITCQSGFTATGKDTSL